MGEIVVGYDGSDCGKAALDEALRAGAGARRPHRGRLRLRAAGVWGGEIADHEEAIEELGEKVMGEAQEQAAGARASRSRSSWSPKRPPRR